MRGSPLLRLAVVVAALLLVLIPLRRLTSRPASSATGQIAETKELATVLVRLILTSTSVPFRFTVTHLGESLWKGESYAESVTREISLPYPDEGIDLLVEARWNAESAAALRIDVLPAGHPASSAILWGNKEAGDVFTFR